MSIKLNKNDHHDVYTQKIIELNKKEPCEFIINQLSDVLYCPKDCTDIFDCEMILNEYFKYLGKTQIPIPEYVTTYINHIFERLCKFANTYCDSNIKLEWNVNYKVL